MRVVNLAKRPFHNRRPVARLAIVLWILGGLLLALNLWKWGGYFQGSSSSGDRLDLLDRQVSQEEVKLDEYWQELRRVRLGARNQKARYLNLLIHRRTFPWSRLFDELEEVLPENVYLEEVIPEVELAKEPKGKKRRRTRALTPRQARELARQRAAGQTTEDGGDAGEDEVKTPLRDRVKLTLNGFARTENALFHFVDLLYAHDSFLDPNLSRESAENPNSPVEFRIKVVYLTPARETFPVKIEELPPPEGGLADAGGQPAVEGSPPPEEGVTASSQVAGSLIPEPTGAETETTASTEAAENAVEEAPQREPGGRGFVEDTLRERRERAARRQSDSRRATPRRSQPQADTEDDSQRNIERSRQSGGSSRVSVAPRQRRGAAAPVGGVSQPTTTAPRGSEERDVSRPRSTRPSSRPSADRNPSQPTGGQQDPRADDRGINRPTPTQPGASSSPRLRGMLNLLPDFLRPELSITEEAA